MSEYYLWNGMRIPKSLGKRDLTFLSTPQEQRAAGEDLQELCRPAFEEFDRANRHAWAEAKTRYIS